MVAGVVLEKHPTQVCENHDLKLRGRNQTISTLNNALKTAQVLDVPRWRRVQRLADLRNFCGYGKEREPTKEEVNELIDGVESSQRLCSEQPNVSGLGLLEMLSAERLPLEPPWSC
jgi:hypothetical protein